MGFLRPAIVGLLPRGCPPAITGLIVAIIVDSVNRQARWRFTHVSKEVLESPPAFADCDAPTPVVAVMFIVWVRATMNHACPRRIGFRLPPSPGMPMLRHFDVSGNHQFMTDASATIGCPFSQDVPMNGVVVSTVAVTQPEWSLAGVSPGKRNNEETTESLSSEFSEGQASTAFCVATLEFMPINDFLSAALTAAQPTGSPLGVVFGAGEHSETSECHVGKIDESRGRLACGRMLRHDGLSREGHCVGRGEGHTPSPRPFILP